MKNIECFPSIGKKEVIGFEMEACSIAQVCYKTKTDFLAKEDKINSMSAFLRQQVVHGIYLEFDKDELQSIRQAIQASANNINQIAKRENAGSENCLIDSPSSVAIFTSSP